MRAIIIITGFVLALSAFGLWLGVWGWHNTRRARQKAFDQSNEAQRRLCARTGLGFDVIRDESGRFDSSRVRGEYRGFQVQVRPRGFDGDEYNSPCYASEIEVLHGRTLPGRIVMRRAPGGRRERALRESLIWEGATGSLRSALESRVLLLARECDGANGTRVIEPASGDALTIDRRLIRLTLSADAGFASWCRQRFGSMRLSGDTARLQRILDQACDVAEELTSAS